MNTPCAVLVFGLVLSCVAISSSRFLDYSENEGDRAYKRDFWGNSLQMMESSRQACALRRCYRYQDCCHGFTCTKYESYESLNSLSGVPNGRCRRIYNSDYFQFR